MKSIIKSIFKEIYGQTSEGALCDRELTDEVNSILEIMEMEIHQEKRSDLVFQSSGHGQELGFISGFKFAIRLICECI